FELSNTKLVFWDLGGQSGLHSIWEKYYEEAHAVVYVIDASCPSCFEDSKSALEKILRHEDLQGAPLLILANKQLFVMQILKGSKQPHHLLSSKVPVWQAVQLLVLFMMPHFGCSKEKI
ncbi:uncharacterized protein LOC104877785, partial [Vitis vinifera]|uniref:uncharacterized protein LOC104877785 n=1 Tax=Vitis vinifera TaxID=29760 RepID=UPI0008FED7DA